VAVQATAKNVMAIIIDFMLGPFKMS
jgi:hypothetical protein